MSPLPLFLSVLCLFFQHIVGVLHAQGKASLTRTVTASVQAIPFKDAVVVEVVVVGAAVVVAMKVCILDILDAHILI